MATKKRKRGQRKTPVPYGDFTPAGKFSLARKAKVRLSPPSVALEVLGGDVPFSYTTPSTREHRTKTERIAMGCRFQKVRKKVIDKSAKPDREGRRPTKYIEREELVPGQPDYCQPRSSAPCGTSRKSCPVQLVFVEGAPALRFCFEKNAKGFAHRFTDIDAAARFAEEACKCWKKTGSFKKCKSLFSEGLIGTRKTKRRKR